MIFDHSGITYNPLQQLTEPYVNKDCNVVVLAPTSSGKTIVAEQFLGPTIMQGKSGLYLSPLKALTNEKLYDWKNKVDSLVAITSDHDKVVPNIGNTQLILMTTEALDSKSRGHMKWLKNIGCVVCDESHLLGVDGRGDAFEIGLTRFASQINKDARIIFLSATMPNAKELGKWLTILNGKPTEIVETEWRPVKLEQRYIKCSNREFNFNGDALGHISRIISKHKDSSILIFVHSLAKGRFLEKHLHIPFHNSRLKKEQRYKIEQDFRSGKIKAIVSTSTLAWGINMPCDIGIIVGAHRGFDMVDSHDLKQMAGRIGRYGLTERGIVYFLLKECYMEDVINELTDIHDIKSVLCKRLYFHVCSFIARETMDINGMNAFIRKTLAYQQNEINENDITNAIEVLRACGVLRDGIEPTAICKACAYMYLDPLDLVALRNNLRDRPRDNKQIAKAFANLPSYRFETTVPKDIPEKSLIEMDYSMQTVVATAIYYWLRGINVPPALQSFVYNLKYDVSRWIAGLKMAGMEKGYLDNLELAIVNGIPYDLYELVSIRGIGRQRAVRLSGHGIATKKDLIDSKNKTIVRNILGQKLYSQVMATQMDGKLLLLF